MCDSREKGEGSGGNEGRGQTGQPADGGSRDGMPETR